MTVPIARRKFVVALGGAAAAPRGVVHGDDDFELRRAETIKQGN